MKLFESRNVLDRIETAWGMFFSPDWRVRVLPQIIIITIGTAIGFASLFPIFFLFLEGVSNLSLEQEGSEPLIWLTKLLIYSLVPITIFTLMSGFVYTYTLTVCHDWEAGKTWKSYTKIAWSRLWGWAWYGFWVVVILGFLFGIGLGAYLISPDIFSFGMLLLFGVFFWGITSLYAGAPGYILANSWKIGGFFKIFGSTSGRWWRVFGNMLLGSIVISSMLSLVQQLLYWVMGINTLGAKITGLTSTTDIDWTGFISDLTPDFWTRFVCGGMLLFVLAGGQRVFVTMFQYVVWKDIETDAPEIVTIEKKEE